MDNNTSTSRPGFNSTAAHTEGKSTGINLEFEMRNIVVGCIGFVANIVAFFVIIKSNKVKEGRKLLLLNLIVSDIGCMVGLSIYGILDSTQVSEGDGCVPMIFFIILFIQNSYTVCLMLSVGNYLAVYKPFKYRKLLSLKNSGIGVSLSWLVNGILMYIWLAPGLPPGLTCAPIVVLPDAGLVGLASVITLSSIGVFGLNGAVIIKLKKTAQRSFVVEDRYSDPQNASHRGAQTRRQPTQTEEEHTALNCLFSLFGKRSGNNKVQPLDVPVKRRKSLPMADSIWMGESNPEATGSQQSADVKVHYLSLNTGNSELLPISMSLINAGRSADETNSSASGSSANNQEGRRPGNQPAIVQTGNETNSRDRICKALVMLTSFSCLITLPLAVYLICIVTEVITDPEMMVGTSIGIFISSCPVTKAGINPFFYALNFVDWRKVKNNIFKRRPQSNV